MERLSFKVAQFDAPLDLILHLISKHKLNIMDIDISSLLEQYLDMIRSWQEQDMDVASEFLEMASRLVYMKTVSLLPRREEESEKLREELSGQLVEYGLCKLVARRLGEWNVAGSMFVRDPAEIEVDKTYQMTHAAAILYEALIDAQGKGARRLPPPRESFDPIVSKPVVSVTSRIFFLLRRLRTGGRLTMDGLFDPAQGRSAMVATFLAVLELVKSKKIAVMEDEIRIHGS
ncbi:MAG: segregation/condensation protein A [Oscillospiraceae bacterium]|jgi:segregation and condensation protein A|nr:segregation/condensation protein A [Oscillospiraceae bacterium]